MQGSAHNASYVISGVVRRTVTDCSPNGGCAEARVGGVLYYWIQMLSLFCTRLARCSTV